MANGKTHSKITYITGLLIGILLFNQIKLKYLVSFVVAYIFAGLMFSGDLDIYSIQYKRWGVLKFIWIPYRRMFNHRSKYTHSAIVGTLIRIVYLIIIFICFLYSISLLVFVLDLLSRIFNDTKTVAILGYIYKVFIFSKEFLLKFEEFVVNVIQKNPQISLIVLLGLICGALSHNLTDIIYSKFKRKRYNKKYYRKRRVW